MNAGEFVQVYDTYGKDGKDITEKLKHFVDEVSKLSLLKVLQEGYYWPIETLYNDANYHDLTKNCISDISYILKKKNNILIIGCSGGGYNTYQLCKEILVTSDFVPQITVIDNG